MQVTDIRVRGVEKEGKMKAVVSITIDSDIGHLHRVYPLVFLICYNAYLKFFSTITLMSSGLP